jgi:hypothetical protein
MGELTLSKHATILPQSNTKQGERMSEAPLTDPKRWENAEEEWSGRTYYTVSLPCLFGKPRKLFESVRQLRAEIESKGYEIPEQGMLLIEPGFLKGRLLQRIRPPRDYDASVTELERAKVRTTVHHGPLKTIKQTADELAEKVKAEKGLAPTRTFYWDFRHGPMFSGQRADRFVIFCLI